MRFLDAGGMPGGAVGDVTEEKGKTDGRQVKGRVGLSVCANDCSATNTVAFLGVVPALTSLEEASFECKEGHPQDFLSLFGLARFPTTANPRHRPWARLFAAFGLGLPWVRVEGVRGWVVAF